MNQMVPSARPEPPRPPESLDPGAGPPRPTRGQRLLRWVVLLVPVLLVAGPVVVGEFPREVALWHGAAALEHHLDGNLDAALQSLDAGLAWDPDNHLLLLQRSQWRLDAGDLPGALEDAELAVASKEHDPAGYLQRSSVFQKMGRHREAIDDWNRLVELADGATRVEIRGLEGTRQMDIYNGRAYARAVANMEIQAGLMDAQRSIDRFGENMAVLDTRGFLYYHAGEYEKARYDLDKAVDEVESYYAQLLRETRDEEGELPEPLRNQPRLRRQFLDLRELRKFQQEMAEQVAVLRYHRALVLDKLGEAEAAERDRQRVRELGFNSGPDLY